ncbi:MAG: FAD-binding protein [Propionibacteriaceae bacterium]|jgi:electron transfer flavoprotein alpha subunit|nr:FAD-binding protein [Propionibacteriaceae bacterium]
MSTYVLVAGDPGVAALVEAAVELGAPVTAVVVGDESLARAAAAPGVDRVVWLGAVGDHAVEAFAAAVAQQVAADPGVVLAGRKAGERALLGAVAATLAAPVVTAPLKIAAQQVTRSVAGGLATETRSYAGPVAIVLDGGAPLAGGGPAAVEPVAAQPAAVTVTGLRPNPAPPADLGSAERVVAVGRGLKAKQDLPIIEALAAALKAELACSRPVAEGLDWVARDRYVGVSGQQISPRLYLAVGISGQLQHMGGCRGSDLIVAINNDPEAPIVAQSDYVLTGDLYALAPALTAALA